MSGIFAGASQGEGREVTEGTVRKRERSRTKGLINHSRVEFRVREILRTQHTK